MSIWKRRCILAPLIGLVSVLLSAELPGGCNICVNVSAQPTVAIDTLLQDAVQENGGKADSSSIYKVAIQWYNNNSLDRAVPLLHHLADVGNHVLSAVKLGHHFTTEAHFDRPLAIKYFVSAGEEGPHHTSLYNAGRLMIEEGDLVGSLAYLRAAAVLSKSYPADFISDETTVSALQAYNILSHQISQHELTMVQLADVFIYGSLVDLSEQAQAFWVQAVHSLIRFNDILVQSSGSHIPSQDVMVHVTQALRSLWEAYATELSDLQTFLLLDTINDMLGPLADLDKDFVPMAAGYAEALATRSSYCWENVATKKEDEDSACFNKAAKKAISLYRREGDAASVGRVLQMAENHPKAASHWNLEGNVEL